MENSLKIIKLETQMEQVINRFDDFDKKLDKRDKERDAKLDKNFKELKEEMGNFVRIEEFMPYKRAWDVVLGVALTAIVGGVLALIFV